MKRRVHFIHYDGYWVAEAENGAITQADTLEACRENIKDAMQELEEYRKTVSRGSVEEFFEEVEVAY